jgi:hypothetical protein
VLAGRSRVRLHDGEVTVELNTTRGSISTRLLTFGGATAP